MSRVAGAVKSLVDVDLEPGGLLYDA